MHSRRSVLRFTSAICASALAGQAFGQGKYPDRPVKVIVALPAGGSVDMIARSLGQKLSASLGQPFVVDNRAGASGQIGMPAVARSAGRRLHAGRVAGFVPDHEQEHLQNPAL